MKDYVGLLLIAITLCCVSAGEVSWSWNGSYTTCCTEQVEVFLFTIRFPWIEIPA